MQRSHVIFEELDVPILPMLEFLKTLLAKRQDATISQAAAISQAVTPHGAPLGLQLVTGTYPVMRGARYVISHGKVSREYGANSTLERTPAPEEWDRFWEIIETLGVRHWRAEYQEPREDGYFTMDGKAWRFRLDAGSFKVSSSGSCGYPSLSDPNQPTTSAEALEIIQAELDRLIAGPQEVPECENPPNEG